MGTEKDFVLVLTTFPVDRDADQFARTLVDESLAACVNILPPMVSIFRWKNAVDRSEERQILIKTRREHLAILEGRLKALHPYEVPEFVVVPITDGSDDYLAWLSLSTSK